MEMGKITMGKKKKKSVMMKESIIPMKIGKKKFGAI